MIEIVIPGKATLRLEHLVCDVNGTLAVDGRLLNAVRKPLARLQKNLQVHLLTADTHGNQTIIDRQLGLQATRIRPGGEAMQKAAYIRKLSAASVVAIGQGANDVLMLKSAALGICVLSQEGTCQAALSAADLVARDIISALLLLENPKRISATLRQ